MIRLGVPRNTGHDCEYCLPYKEQVWQLCFHLLLVHNYYPAVRTGSSNTHFFFRVFFLFGGHLPQTSGFRSAKQILVVSFATHARAFILSDHNIFYIPRGGGRTMVGSNAPGAFLVF